MRHWRSIDRSRIAKCPSFMGATKTKKVPTELAQTSPRMVAQHAVLYQYLTVHNQKFD